MTRIEKMKLIYRYNTGEDDWKYKCINAYKIVGNPQKWEVCTKCGLIPKIWTYDNGRSTACGCGEDEYSHHSIRAESVMSVVKHSHNGTSVVDYDSDELRKNWNHFIKTGVELFVHAGKRNDNKW